MDKVIAHYNPSLRSGLSVRGASPPRPPNIYPNKHIRMAKTSIHIEPIKPSSEKHNRREKELDYIKPELTHLNESWELDSVANRLDAIKQNYFRNTGQKLQKKATPIREGVVVIDKATSMEDLRRFAEKIEERYKIKTIQIHIHRDEGHHKASEWKPNLHAHLVFDWTDSTTGKTLKLKRQDMAEIQTILAECLGMERGKSSDRQHLTAMQYKSAAEEERLMSLEKQVKHLNAKYALNSLLESITHVNEKKTLKNENNALKKHITDLEVEVQKQSEKINSLINRIEKLDKENDSLRDRLSSNSRAAAIEGEKRAVMLINKKLRECGLPEIDYRAYGSGYENCVYLKGISERNRGLER